MQALFSAIEPAARVAVATLFNSLWEAALLALAVWAILRVFPNLNATTRYAAWCVALAGSLLLPIFTAIPQISVQHQPSAIIARTAAHLPASTASKHPPSTAIAKVAGAPAPDAAPPRTSAFKLPNRLRFSVPNYVALTLFAAWIAAALLLLARLGVNLWRLEHLKRDALPLPVDYRERLSQWTIAEKGQRDVRLCVCDRIEVPVAVGLFDSMILIPQHLLDSLSPGEIDQIMLHELGHLRRADDWTNGVQRLIQALFFFNPAILYIAQQLDLEREVACDDWVVHQTKSVRPYASCLTKMAEVTTWPHRPLAAPGVFVSRRGLSIRVERLLRAGRNVRTSLSIGPAGAVVAALVVLFFVLQSVAPSFAFTQTSASASPAARSVARSASTAARSSARPQRAKIVTAKEVVRIAAVTSPSPRPAPTDIIVPAQRRHIPARTVRIPAVDVDVPERHIQMPAPPALPASAVMPKDFGSQIDRQVNSAMHAALAANRQNGFNCVGCDFSGQNLAGHSFHGQRLNGADFSRANLQNADFSKAVLLGADFSRADLRGASFAHAMLTGCDLSHTMLTGVNFEGVQMTGCNIDAPSLSPAQARAVLLACRMGCDFSGANLSGQDLRGLAAVGVDLSRADLRGADLSGSRLNGVDLSGARLAGARLNGSTLTGCDLSGVDLSKVDLSNVTMSGDKLTP